MLRHITIKQLFSEYDYEIDMHQEGLYPEKGILFLTGPNGMGKSTILRCVASLYKMKFSYFLTFPFESMAFDFDMCRIELTQTTEQPDIEKESDVMTEGIVRVRCSYTTKGDDPRTSYGEWIMQDRKLGTVVNDLSGLELYFKSERCLYISDNRLENDSDDANVQTHLIKEVLTDIQRKLSENFHAAATGTLANGKSVEERQKAVLDVFEELYDYEIELPIDIEPYLNGDRMSDFHLHCCENAIDSCRDDIERVSTFRKFVEVSKFVNKDFSISTNHGYQFFAKNNEKTMLAFDRLSLGEKHIISQMYTMLFSPIRYSLVLIDEPEQSFHLMWQMQFLGNILRVKKLRNTSFLIATHSSQVFDGKFALTTDLFSQFQKQQP